MFAKNARVNFPLGNPLVLAAQGAHVEALRVLLKAGAPYSRPDPNGATVLDDAEVQQGRASDPTARAKYAQIIALLKKAGTLEASQRAELHAVNHDDVARLQLLFAHGASANFVDGDAKTPLMLAAEGAHGEAVQFLLAHGANVNAEDNMGRTSLDIAAFWAKVWAKESQDPLRCAKYAQTIALLAQAGGQRGMHRKADAHRTPCGRAKRLATADQRFGSVHARQDVPTDVTVGGTPRATVLHLDTYGQRTRPNALKSKGRPRKP